MRLASVLLLLASLTIAAGMVACGGGGKGSKTATVIVTKQATTAGTTGVPTPTLEILASPTSEVIPPVTGQPTVTSSGLQIYDIQVGSGTEAKAGSIIQIKFKEWFASGEQAENTTLPIEERLTSGHVIAGWLEGIPGMKEGGRRRLIVPPDLVQGEAGVPPNTSVTYDIELVAVVQQ